MTTSRKINANCPECGVLVFRYVPPMRPMWVLHQPSGDHATLSVEPVTKGWHQLDLEANERLLKDEDA